MIQNVFLTLHNAHSRSIIVQFVQTALGFGFKHLILSKASGSAATAGVPEAFKLSFPRKASIIIMNNLSEAIELIKPQEVYLILSKKYAPTPLDFQQVAEHLNNGDRIAFIFGGSSPGLSRKDLDLGMACHVTWVEEEISPIAYLGILLDNLRFLRETS